MTKRYELTNVVVLISQEEVELKYTYYNKQRTTKRKVIRKINFESGMRTMLFKGLRFEITEIGQANNGSKGLRLIGKYNDRVEANPEAISILIDGNKDNQEITHETEIEEEIEYKEDQEIKHAKFDEIKICVSNEIPVYLHGPAGSGKNHVLQQIADELKLDFYFTNSVQQEFKITGFIDAGGKYHETEFYKAFTHGGLFFLDEMDASIPEVLVLLNAALANGYFEFPTGKVDAHDDFRVVSAGNTVGSGADEQYAGRLQLDQATLDRFAMIEFDYDRNIELAISKGNKDLVDFIRSLRDQSENLGIPTTFSYRSITMVTKLEGKIDLAKIMTMAVVKGLDPDTVRTFDITQPGNKYFQALNRLQRAS